MLTLRMEIDKQELIKYSVHGKEHIHFFILKLRVHNTNFIYHLASTKPLDLKTSQQIQIKNTLHRAFHLLSF